VKVELVYIFPNLKSALYEPLARRFVRSYMEFPPGEHAHQLTVVVNGSPPNDRQKQLFEPLPVIFRDHNNYGKDIGAYFSVASDTDADLLICLGAPLHFHKPGWLDRIVDVYMQGGPGLYGCWGFDQPNPHIRTTAFWLPPLLLAGYPHSLDNNHRYQFEHGSKTSILQWTLKCGFPVFMVTWSEVKNHTGFIHVPLEDCLMIDQHADRMRSQ
jgi:hypothetical protein